MELVIVTGMSGAGKSTVISILEDIGYYCVDNIPPEIIPSVAGLSLRSQGMLEKLAVVTDVRGGDMFKSIIPVLDSLEKNFENVKVLFLEGTDEELVRRYKENRRSHPLFASGCTTIADAVKLEREQLAGIRQRADYILDTTFITSPQLKQRVLDLFAGESGMLKIHCMSFGFKHGHMSEADLVFDVRCLPNPYYDPALRPLTGMVKEVRDFVLGTEEAKEFLQKLTDFIDTAMPLYKAEGKSSLLIAFGCTGGQHRSVTFAELICEHLKQTGYTATVSHRDMDKNHC